MVISVPIKKADRKMTETTPRELNVIEKALLGLSGVCDGARSQDKHGFNGTDSPYGKSLAAQVEAGRKLSYKQAFNAIKFLPKYKKQLIAMGLEVPTRADFFTLYPFPRRVEVIGDEIALFMPYYDRALIEIAMLESRYNVEDNSYRFPLSSAEAIWEGLPPESEFHSSDDFSCLLMDCGF